MIVKLVVFLQYGVLLELKHHKRMKSLVFVSSRAPPDRYSMFDKFVDPFGAFGLVVEDFWSS